MEVGVGKVTNRESGGVKLRGKLRLLWRNEDNVPFLRVEVELSCFWQQMAGVQSQRSIMSRNHRAQPAKPRLSTKGGSGVALPNLDAAMNVLFTAMNIPVYCNERCLS
ncbi:hypothetical protein VNO80_09300 [Phaseolus coccineus]|uniref:Uncharacterized protein n=1 Tax=Phaseolus coccineus TaxID=3886 RepID=A0AAN9N6J7_PHACN